MVESEFSLVRFSGDEEQAGKVYAGMMALSPEDGSEVLLFGVTRPEHVNVSEMLILPLDQVPTQMIHRRID
ncbi:MAG: hypothetical protein JSU61_07890 [Fidelibacterota bacterium]|nr:MAG: hypothetical protein JSU61_07890 [Candidatus Neomarinimicrobiota bacterium]